MNNASPKLARLAASETHYRRLFEAARDGILILDAHTGKITDANPFMLELLSYKYDEFIGKELWEIGLLADEAANKAAFRELLEVGYIRYEDLPLKSKNGKEREIEFVSNIYDEGGDQVIQCNIRDITKRKKLERDLIESEARKGAILESALDCIIAIDDQGLILEFNPAAERVFGYSRVDVIGKALAKLIIPPASREDHWNGLARFRESGEGPMIGQRIEVVAMRSDKSEFPAELAVSVLYLKGEPTFTAYIRDLTEQKEERDQAEQKTALLRLAGRIAHLGGWTIELPSRTLTWSDENCVIHDVPRGYEPTLEEGIASYLPEHRAEVMRCVDACERDGTSYDFELPITTAKGRQIWVRSIGEAVRDASGKIVRLQGAIQDITDRKLAEEVSRQKDSLIRIANNLTRTGGWALEVADNKVFWSEDVFELLEFPPGEPPKLAEALALYPEPGRETVVAGLEACSTDGIPLDIEVEIFTATGRRLWVRLCAEADRDADGKITRVQGAFQDITSRRYIEDQLRQGQKLESIGLLAGGIAHDFNNMLTAINGYSELTLRRMTDTDPLRGNLLEIKNAGERSSALTNQLLAFSRLQILQPEVLYINRIISDTGNMLERLIGENIQLVTVLNPKVGQVKVDPGQLSQIITNLAVNARDAMPYGGKLTFETGNVFLDFEYAKDHTNVLPGAYVMLAVSDTGTGMDPVTKIRLFEPFYTTKAVGKGTGLGLATVYGIVKQSGGNINVYSEMGVGTTFKIYLPRVMEPDEASHAEPHPDEILTGTETILLVEDEEIVRRLARQVLEMGGYTIIEAPNGREALAFCKAHHRPIDMLMTDVVMPEMGGPELAVQIRDLFPDMAVLFTSGYTDDAIVRHGVIEASTNFIQKPFTTIDLARKVRQILDSRKESMRDQS
ncbi:MAG: PAS domain S-box protein [Acidobacteriota bacterium]